MRISDWSSDVCSSDLDAVLAQRVQHWIDLRGGEHKVAGNRRLATAGRLKVDCDGRSHRHRQLHAAVARCLGTRDAERIDAATDQIGRATCRERVCQYV